VLGGESPCRAEDTRFAPVLFLAIPLILVAAFVLAVFFGGDRTL
jgi:hypothetical protein